MANLTETSRWEAGIYQFETSDPVMGGPNGIDNRPTRELANRTLWLKNEIAQAVESIGTNKTAADQAIALKANAATMLTAGAGLTGGGTLAANRSFALATPSTLNGSTTNWAGNGATGHTHELAKATATVAGVVKLANALDVSATDAALTAAMGKKLQDEKIGNSGAQTLNGQLNINQNAWEKLRFTNADNSFWRFESAPPSSGENGARFNYVFTGAEGAEIGRITFPRVSGGETVAYQSWVNNLISGLNESKVPSTAYDYWASKSTNYSKSGFYRGNGAPLNGLPTPSMEIHIAHPSYTDNEYGRGIGFGYGPSFDLVTTAWDAEGVYQGMKKILTEENGVMLTGNQTVGGTKTFSNRADFSHGLRISGSNTEQYSVFLRGSADWYWSNPISGQSLQLKDNGDLAYQNRKIYHEGNKPTWNDIQSKPAVAEMNKTNTGSFTAGGQIKASYAADWVGFIANQETEGRNVYFDASVRDVLRAGMQAKAVGTNGEYCMSLQVTPPGDKTRDRRVEGLGVYASGLHNHTYGWLHEFFARRTEMNEKSTVKVMTGLVYDGGTIPLPAGYSQEQCQWFVSLREDNTGGEEWDINENRSHNHFAYQIWADGNRRVHAKMHRNAYAPRSIHVNYIIIGVK